MSLDPDSMIGQLKILNRKTPEASNSSTQNYVPPPQGIMLTPGTNDILTFNLFTTTTLTFSLRYLIWANGTYSSAALVIIGNGNGTTQTASQPLGGILVSLKLAQAGLLNPLARHGQAYGVASLNGSVSGRSISLCQGYISLCFNPSWGPNISTMEQSTDGTGYTHTVSLPQPSAGTDYATVTVPTYLRWKVRGFYGQLTTSAVAGNRFLTAYLTDGTNDIGGGGEAATQGPTQTNNHFWGIGSAFMSGAPASGQPISSSLPDIPLSGGYTVNFSTAALNAGDQWGPGFLTVEEWINP